MNSPSGISRLASKGIPFVISAPSGAGKSTIAARIVQNIPSAMLSISCTTRKPRNGEKDGRDYFFMSTDEFKRQRDAGKFLEWAEVHGQYYGTPLDELKGQLKKGRDVILTIDPLGAMAVKKIYPDGVFIFLVPPTWDALLKRLYARATDDASSMEIRVANARKELSYLSHYDYLVINDDLETAIRDVSSILIAEHHRLIRIDQKDIPLLSSDHRV